MDFDGDLSFKFGEKSAPHKGRRGTNSHPSREETPSGEDAADRSLENWAGSEFSRSPISLQDLEAPPRQRHAGGWADEGAKSGKKRNTSNIIEHERFHMTEEAKNGSDDDIPIIPDLDDIQDEELTTEISSAYVVNLNKVTAYKELDSDLFKNAAFATLENVNLQLLTKCLNQENYVKEEDKPWMWDLLFTGIASELNSEWDTINQEEKEVL